jgi:hypothetical protein
MEMALLLPALAKNVKTPAPLLLRHQHPPRLYLPIVHALPALMGVIPTPHVLHVLAIQAHLVSN